MSEPHTNQHHHDQDPPVHRITEAHESHAVEQRSRVLKYTISMSVRMACFIAAFFVHGWLQWVFLAGAIVLPYVAVVIANGGADLTKREPPAEFFDGDDPRLLTAGGPAEDPANAAAAGTQHPGVQVFTVNEDGETIPEADDVPDPVPQGTGAFDPAPGEFPAEAPTTIDGVFVDEPETTEPPLHGRPHRGGAR